MIKKRLTKKEISRGKWYLFLILLLGTGLAAWCFLVKEISREHVLEPVTINGKAAVIIEARTGEVLFEKNADSKYPPASTTKVMTALVAVEKLPLNRKITPSKKALQVEPTVAGLTPGAGYTLKDLLAAILVKSANDAARVIAEGVAGSQEGFVKEMNLEALRLGMTNTYFANPSGLPAGRRDDGQYTTARDLAEMMKYAARYRAILDAMSKKDLEITGSDGKRIYLKTHNKALFKYPDAPWGKTGYTRNARRTFVGVDPSYRPRIVFALLKSDSLWSDIMTLKRKGLEIYLEKNRTFFGDLVRWIAAQRQRGRKETRPVRARP